MTKNNLKSKERPVNAAETLLTRSTPLVSDHHCGKQFLCNNAFNPP